MEKEFVSYEQAVALKELGCGVIMNYRYWKVEKNILVFHISKHFDMQSIIDKGFDVECLNVYAPLKQQVFGWFREKYDYVAYVRANESSYCWCIHYQKTVRGLYDQYDSYEEAENACIDKLIELAKKSSYDHNQRPGSK